MRRDPVVATPTRVEDRGEHARRIKPRAAVPVDSAVAAHQRNAVQVTDQTMIGNRQIFAHRSILAITILRRARPPRSRPQAARVAALAVGRPINRSAQSAPRPCSLSVPVVRRGDAIKERPQRTLAPDPRLRAKSARQRDASFPRKAGRSSVARRSSSRHECRTCLCARSRPARLMPDRALEGSAGAQVSPVVAFPGTRDAARSLDRSGQLGRDQEVAQAEAALVSR